jgi:hypothetical protein
MDHASGSPALLSEGDGVCRGVASGLAVKLSSLVLMFIFTIFPETADSGFADTGGNSERARHPRAGSSGPYTTY